MRRGRPKRNDKDEKEEQQQEQEQELAPTTIRFYTEERRRMKMSTLNGSGICIHHEHIILIVDPVSSEW